MKGLIPLIKVLRPSEKQLLHHHLSRSSNAEEKLRLRLFKLVDSGKVLTDDEAKLKLKATGGASAYSHLKRRLKSDILNILLLQDSSKRFAQANRAAELDCRKKVAQSHVLLLRGAQVEGMKILESALASADEYELLAERLQIHHLLREKFLGARSTDELVELNKKIQDDMQRYQALLNVQEKSFVLASPEFALELKKRANDKKYLELIEELSKLYRKHRLARIGFWYYMAATEYHSARTNFDQVVELGLKFLKLVQTSPAVHSKTNMAGVNQTVGVAYLQLRSFENAQKYLTQASALFPSAGFNRLQSLQFLVQAESALGDFDNALKNTGRALSHPRVDKREQLIPRWLFIKSSVEFLAANPQESFRTLNQDSYLIKQVDSWNVQFRFLEMMQLIEFKDEDWLEFKVNATRKFFTRHKELATPRAKATIDIVSNLLRNGLDFQGLSAKNLDLLRSSVAEAEGFEWNPIGPEIVRFDKWVVSKIPNWNQEADEDSEL